MYRQLIRRLAIVLQALLLAGCPTFMGTPPEPAPGVKPPPTPTAPPVTTPQPPQPSTSSAWQSLVNKAKQAAVHLARGDGAQARSTAERGLLYCNSQAQCDALRGFVR